MKANDSKTISSLVAGTAKELTAAMTSADHLGKQDTSQGEKRLKSILPRLENQPSHRGRPRMSRVRIRERRLEIWRLHLAGLSEDEISMQLNIDKSAVSRHLKHVREHNSWTGQGLKDLHATITREVYDVARQTRQESYKVLYDPSNQNRPEIRLGAISRIQSTIRPLGELGQDLESLAIREELDEIEGILDRIAEKPMTKRMVPPPDRPNLQP